MPSNSKWLILVPTDLERQKLSFVDLPNVRVELCGFGAIIAGARTTLLLQQYQPEKVLLLGIAGTYDPTVQMGRAYQFQKVACYGIGAGAGESFVGPQEMGWDQWSGEERTIQDEIELTCSLALSDRTRAMLLSTCAASAHQAEADQKRLKYPEASAEDMEGFAVAAAARLLGYSLHIVRGISNTVGNRELRLWRIDEAMTAANQLAVEILEAEG